MMMQPPHEVEPRPMTEWEKGRGKVVPTGQAVVPVPPPQTLEVVEEEMREPPGQWYQPYWKPCRSPDIMAYSVLCCCCAMGDIGCYTRKRFYCYPAYCLFAWCPCCLGWARELLAEELNLEVKEIEPEDCTGWIVRCIGMRVFCFVTYCCLLCMHVIQMRAELAYRRHGEATLCPCCCLECGKQYDVTKPPAERKVEAPDTPGYPRQPGFGSAPKATAAAATTDVVSAQPAPLSEPNNGAIMAMTQTSYFMQNEVSDVQQVPFGSQPGGIYATQNVFSSQHGQYGQPTNVPMIHENFGPQPGYPAPGGMYGHAGGYGVQHQMIQR